MPFKPGRPANPANPGPEDRYELAAEGHMALVTNWDQFKTKFGDFHMANRSLAHAVYGFLNNGGTTCYVTRVSDLADAAAVDGALKKYEAIDEIALVAAPGALGEAVQLKIIEHCETMKDRFAIIDGQETDSIDVDSIKGPIRNSDQAAIYFPRVVVFDPVSAGALPVHPSGHVAGVYARVDQARGVHMSSVVELSSPNYAVSDVRRKRVIPNAVHELLIRCRAGRKRPSPAASSRA